MGNGRIDVKSYPQTADAEHADGANDIEPGKFAEAFRQAQASAHTGPAPGYQPASLHDKLAALSSNKLSSNPGILIADPAWDGTVPEVMDAYKELGKLIPVWQKKGVDTLYVTGWMDQFQLDDTIKDNRRYDMSDGLSKGEVLKYNARLEFLGKVAKAGIKLQAIGVPRDPGIEDQKATIEDHIRHAPSSKYIILGSPCDTLKFGKPAFCAQHSNYCLQHKREGHSERAT